MTRTHTALAAVLALAGAGVAGAAALAQQTPAPAQPTAAPATAPTAPAAPKASAAVAAKPAAEQAPKATAAAAKAAAAKPAAAPGTPAAAPVANDAEAARRAQVLASFDGGKVTVGDIEDAVGDQSPFMRRRYAKQENRQALYDKLVRFELLASEAERRGYGEDPVVVQAVKQNAVQRLMKTEFDDKITAQSIPAEDVKQYYEEHREEFVRPATRRASHILVATAEEAQALITEARSLDMRGFRQLARDKSLDEETKLRGGDLRYLDAEGRLQGEKVARLPPELARAIFALKNVGDVASKPIKMPGGFSVLKLTGIRPANERTLQQADETIRARLWRERRQGAIDAFVAKLRADAKPEVHAELVDLIKFDPTDIAKTSGIPSGFPADKARESGEH